MDQASTDLLNLLHPKLRTAAIMGYNNACARTPKNVHPVIAETLRSFERSDALYKLGRTVVNPDGKSKTKPMGDIVSFAQAGTSWHNYGLAFDFSLKVDGKTVWDVDKNWMIVVHAFEEQGFNSGLNFPKGKIDPPHLENKLGQTLSSLLYAYHQDKFIPGTHYVNF